MLAIVDDQKLPKEISLGCGHPQNHYLHGKCYVGQAKADIELLYDQLFYSLTGFSEGSTRYALSSC
jgi:hypothetical protein